MPKPKKRKGYEWSLEDDLRARDDRDWDNRKPKSRKPVKAKPKAKAKSGGAVTDVSGVKVKPGRLVEAQARSAALLKDRKERSRRDQIAAANERKKRMGKEAGKKLAISKSLISKGKEIGRIKGLKKNPVGRTAGRLNAQALREIGVNSPYAMELASRWTKPGGSKSELRRNAGIELMDDIAARKYDRAGARKTRGAKPQPFQIEAQKRQMKFSRGKKLAGIIPVVATLASGWLSGELNKKGKR
jgi:hypothetical protein